VLQFGYDPNLNPPNYGVPDGEVVNNTKEVQDNKDFWEVRSRQLVALMEKRNSEE
jgi:protein-tyrosine sulfotransferase